MNILAGIIGLTLVGFIIIVLRSLRYVPSKRPNFAEKELTYVAPTEAPRKKQARRFYILPNGTIIKKEFCQC